ncbi:MAG: hypothetical protein AAFN94_02480 [Pseudomonadota bacterium]
MKRALTASIVLVVATPLAAKPLAMATAQGDVTARTEVVAPDTTGHAAKDATGQHGQSGVGPGAMAVALGNFGKDGGPGLLSG